MEEQYFSIQRELTNKLNEKEVQLKQNFWYELLYLFIIFYNSCKYRLY